MEFDHHPSLPRVVIYADPLLAPSMTFVRSQAEALTRYLPIYVGARKLQHNSLALPRERTLVINANGTRLGRFKELPLKVFGSAPLFSRRVRAFDPVLLHAHFGPAALTALPLARSLGIPLIATFHGYDATVFDDCADTAHYGFRRYVHRRKILQTEGTLLIAVSQFIRSQLLEQGFSADQIVQHYIGIDTEYFAVQGGPEREPIVLFVARLAEKKGCEFLIQAMSQVQNERPECELVIIGEGSLRPELERSAKTQLRRYRFLGLQPAEVIRNWMAKARVFCVPSVRASSGDGEGFGLVFIEAQAMKLPVVSFASCGVPEAVAHGETGFLAPERDWRSLAGHISRLLTDTALWDRMSMAGRERVCERFDLSKQTRKLEQIYDDVLAHKLPTKSEGQSARAGGQR